MNERKRNEIEIKNQIKIVENAQLTKNFKIKQYKTNKEENEKHIEQF